MIPEFGLLSLIIAFLLALSGTLAPGLKLLPSTGHLFEKITPMLILGQAFFILISFMSLVFCFVQDDFSVQYVAQNSNSQLPLIYKICALWGAHEGSLLLWALILALWSLAVYGFARTTPPLIKAVVFSILSGIQLGFLLILLQTSNPFLRLLPFSPEEGGDLNPLLQDPAFVIHPPMLYMGYVGFAIPFAYAMAECLLKQPAQPWSTWARPWALLALGFLTIGITLGSWWAYYELGWGGWWFWDPVENASLMPWFVGAALIHSLWVSNHQITLLTNWRLFLAIFALLLSVMGTFLVRSGILSSVHAFASSPERGAYILGFLTLLTLFAFGVYLRNLKLTVRETFGLFSKVSMILLGNMILVVTTLTIMLGTLYPLVAQMLWHQQLSVGPPYFNSVLLPILLPMLILMSVAVHVKWRQVSASNVRATLRLKHYGVPLSVGLMVILALGHRVLPLWSLLGVLFASILILSTLVAAFKSRSLNKLSMVLAHLGVGIFVIGVALSSAWQTEKELVIHVDQTLSVEGYQFRFNGITEQNGSNYVGQRGDFTILKNDRLICRVFPEKRYFMARESLMTETAIYAHWLRDFYVALGEPLEAGGWSVRFYIKPFIRWIWGGALLIALASLIAGFRGLSRSFVWVENKVLYEVNGIA